MNLHQLRFVWHTAKCGFNLTEAAKSLHTSQPGVSKAILELEDELGLSIFERKGKRISGFTDSGRALFSTIDQLMVQLEHLKSQALDLSRPGTGALSIATTHTQARYVLPPSVAQLRHEFPELRVILHQGSPQDVAQSLIEQTVDLGMATEALDAYEELWTLPAYEWHHVLVVPHHHPLASVNSPSLAEIAEYPLISYQNGYYGRQQIDMAFEHAQCAADWVLEAIDSDVIKTYVRLGMGVGIVAEMAWNAETDADLKCIPLGHLVGRNVAKLAMRKGAYLSPQLLRLIQLISPRLSPELLKRTLNHSGPVISEWS